MQPLFSAMTSIREAIVAAIKSLLKGKSFFQALLAFWAKPTFVKTQDGETRRGPSRRIADFLKEAETLLIDPNEGAGLKDFADKLKRQFREGLMSDPACMLPSYNHLLPTGFERGHYLTLDVGGSTLRVALVELRSRGDQGSESLIVSMESFKITPEIKKFDGVSFFAWMAARVRETTEKAAKLESAPDGPLPVSVAWSFPIEYALSFSLSFSLPHRHPLTLSPLSSRKHTHNHTSTRVQSPQSPTTLPPPYVARPT